MSGEIASLLTVVVDSVVIRGDISIASGGIVNSTSHLTQSGINQITRRSASSAVACHVVNSHLASAARGRTSGTAVIIAVTQATATQIVAVN